MELSITQTEEGNFKYKFVINEVYSKQIILTKEVHESIKDYYKDLFKPKTKRKEKKPSPAPTLEDVKEYFKKEGYTIDSAERFFKYYDSMEWYDKNGSPVIRWKGKAQANWMKPENKIKEEVKPTSSFFR